MQFLNLERPVSVKSPDSTSISTMKKNKTKQYKKYSQVVKKNKTISSKESTIYFLLQENR